MANSSLNLYKENFKFSAAHFLIFDAKNAERLHGHNYQVSFEVFIPNEASFQNVGFFIDFKVFKEFVRQFLSSWDEYVLLPGLNPEIKTHENGPSLEVSFRDRYYVFPKNEVQLLPISNTSVEQFSKLIAEAIFKEFKDLKILGVKVNVEETKGQSASFVKMQDLI